MSPPPALAERPSFRVVAVPAGALIAAAIAAYANALSTPFVFDDGPAVAAAAGIVHTGDLALALRPGADTGETTSGRPLLTLSLALNYALSGAHPGSYHATNLLIHALAGLALFGVTRRTLAGSRVPERLRAAALPLAAAVAGLWTLHPLQTQAVTYTVQRAESLAGLLVLLTLYGFIRSTGSPHPGRWRTLSLLACLLGIATKEVAAAAPLIVFLHDRTFVAGAFREAWRHRWSYYLGLAGTWVPLAALVASTGGRGGTAGFDAVVGPWSYLLTQCHAIAHYLRLAVWPHPLVFDYGTDVIRDVSAVMIPATLLVLLAAATAWAMRRPSAWGFLGCFFFAVLAPSSSVVPIASQTVAEHRMYLALIAPLALAVAAMHASLGRRSSWVCALLATACAWLTHQRNEVFQSELSLWADTVAKRPANARAHHNLGLAELKLGRVDAAMARFQTAARLRPDFADSHYNLGLCLARLGRPVDAMAHYERALAQRPDHAQAHNNLGNALLALERAAEAQARYERAVALRPDFPEAHSNLADTLLRRGEAALALRHAETALRLQPDFAEARFNAGNACAELQRPADARAHYEAALQADPQHAGAHNNLANTLIELGRLPEAVPYYEQALRLQPNYVDPRRNLARLLVHLGRPADALPHLEELSRSLPSDPEFARVLGEVRAALRR